MNYFKVGVNFDKELIPVFEELNDKYHDKSVISEVYGSIRLHSAFAARPDFRLPDVSLMEFKDYVKRLDEAGIKFNYTLNSIMPFGSKCELAKKANLVKSLIYFLEDAGVYRVTVANPMMLEMIRNVAKSDIKIEVSTIAHVDTVTQIKYLKDTYNIDKVCGNVLKNRDFNFIGSAARYCNDNGIIYELMANEFCGVGGDGYATHCVYRDSCYLCHATNKTLEDANSFDEYPMKLCTGSRNKKLSNWLKLRWIRPEDLHVYRSYGVNHFKITGRTGSTEYIRRTLGSYMSEDFDGNLIALWKPLESIKGESEFDISQSIDNKSLDGFISIWSKGGHVCDYEVCGETCKYCDSFLERVMGEVDG